MAQYNPRSPSAKRIMREMKELAEATDQYAAAPLENNIFEWHFTIKGPDATPFENGIYHGRIILPPEYPLKPPAIVFLTPNGRFEVGAKICLSISNYHPESWQPSWSIRTVLLALISFLPTEGQGAVAALEYSASEREKLAKKSVDWKCSTCGVPNRDLLAKEPSSHPSDMTSEEQDLINQLTFKGEGSANKQRTTSEGEGLDQLQSQLAPTSPPGPRTRTISERSPLGPNRHDAMRQDSEPQTPLTAGLGNGQALPRSSSPLQTPRTPVLPSMAPSSSSPSSPSGLSNTMQPNTNLVVEPGSRKYDIAIFLFVAMLIFIMSRRLIRDSIGPDL